MRDTDVVNESEPIGDALPGRSTAHVSEGHTAAPNSAAPEWLFRKAAVANSHRRLEGQVLLIQPTPITVLVWAVGAMIAVAIVFFASFSYSTYERVSGVLRNTGGELKVYPNSTAVIEKLHVAQGNIVNAGAPLAVLRSDEKADRGRSDKELQLTELERQSTNLERNKQRAMSDSAYELEKLRLGVADAQARLATLRNQTKLLEQQLDIDRSILNAREKMKGSGYVSVLDVETSKSTVLKTEERLHQLRAEQTEMMNLIARHQAEINALPGQLSQRTAMIDNEVSDLRRQIIQLNTQIEHTLYARRGGRVANIVALEGELVQPQFPLLTLTEPNAELIAELYVPSRSRAFIREGLAVYIRCESFPSEYYGVIRGTVIEVSNVMLFPDDWPNPLKIQRPVYKVIARLDRQHMSVDGEVVNLQQGLSIDADIVLERRTMLEHLLAPILKVKNSLH